MICQSTSVDNQESPLFSVYPNPCQNYINIENLKKINNVVVVDIIGKIVLESQLNTGVNQINISALCKVFILYIQ